MDNKVRVRFAPSPTGPLHIGGVRTALFNYLFAKKNNGSFIVRIEDTDQNRFVEGAERYIIDALTWCGIESDEGPHKGGSFEPYRQSKRKHLYKKYADQLLTNKNAYIAFDSSESLEAHRKDHEAKGKTFIYNWHNRLKLDNSLKLSEMEVSKRIANNEPYVIRFKTPTDEQLHLKDLIRGDIIIDTNTLDDKILFKSDGMPTYHLANIVDDHLMQISHVIRGEEWLPSLALHTLLYRALEWNPPKFAHLPLILKPTGKGKLSKRDGDKYGFPVFPLNWNEPSASQPIPGFKESGYFPEALVNFLAFLGWNPGTEQELFTLDELINNFSIDRVHKGGARFDPDKIKWFNHQYLQKQSDSHLRALFKPLLVEKAGLLKTSDTQIEKAISLIKERATFVSDFWELGHYFFKSPDTLDTKSQKKAWKSGTSKLMSDLKTFLESLDDFSNPTLKEVIKNWMNTQEVSPGKVMMPLRLCLVGSLQGPDVFEIMNFIGKEETLKRIDKALHEL